MLKCHNKLTSNLLFVITNDEFYDGTEYREENSKYQRFQEAVNFKTIYKPVSQNNHKGIDNQLKKSKSQESYRK